VVPDQEHLGDLADGRSPIVPVPADDEQELMLWRRESGRACLLLAPPQKTTQADPELE
jgi:hypothetical protein